MMIDQIIDTTVNTILSVLSVVVSFIQKILTSFIPGQFWNLALIVIAVIVAILIEKTNIVRRLGPLFISLTALLIFLILKLLSNNQGGI